MFSFSQLTNYKMVLIINEPSCGLQAFIALHTGNKQMPAFGATRFWRYASQEEAFQDSLRLAKFMSYKAALAGLPYGGAKGVIIDYPGINREKALKKYAEYVELLGGRFITGSDIGIAQQDVKNWKRLSQYFVGVKVDPVKYTVLGIISGILASLEFRFGSKDPSQKTFAIQGLGKIGSGILQSLYGKAKKIYVTDISKDVVSAIKVRFPKVQVVPVSKIFSVQVDVVVPCALYGAINPTTVKQLKCQIVAGGANNQLASDKMGFELAKRNILYAPDFVINAGGMISVVDEYEHGKPLHSRLLKRISVVERRLTEIFEEYTKTGVPTNVIANKIAESSIQQYE